MIRGAPLPRTACTRVYRARSDLPLVVVEVLCDGQTRRRSPHPRHVMCVPLPNLFAYLPMPTLTHAHTLRAQVYAPETTAGPFDEYMMTFLKGALVDFQEGMYCLTTDIDAAMAKFSCVPGLSTVPFTEERMATFLRVRGKKAKKMRKLALKACGVNTNQEVYDGFYGDLLKPVLLLIDGAVESPALEEALRTCRRDKIKIIITGRSVHVTTLRL